MLALIFFSFIGFMSAAQTGTPPPPMPPPPPGLPIDSSIIVLFILALVYGIYKVQNLSKQAD
jgi:hypothetical protein